MIASSGFLTTLECTQFVFVRGSATDPRGSLQHSLRLLSCLRGPTSKGRGGERGVRKRTGGTAPLRKFLDLPLSRVLIVVRGGRSELCFYFHHGFLKRRHVFNRFCAKRSTEHRRVNCMGDQHLFI